MSNPKCSQCGLVNWSSATTCKRCSWDLELKWRPEYMPESDPAAAGPAPLFSGILTFFVAVLMLALVACLLSRVFHAFDPETARVVAMFILLGGILLMAFANLWMLFRIFEQSVLWGLATLCIPLAGLFAIAKFWETTKRSFVGQLLCMGIVLLGIEIVPS